MTHWDALRAAIDERGLSGLIAADGEAAMGRMMRELEKGADGATVDPLVGANNAICNNALNVAEMPVEASGEAASLISATLATGAGSRPRRGSK